MELNTYLKGIADAVTGKNGTIDYEETLKAILKITGGDSTSSRVPDKPTLGESSSYERMTYDAPTDEEIAKRAITALSEYLSKGLSAIESESKAKSDEYGKIKENLATAYESGRSSLDSTYDEAIKRASNDALKRGLARSSIAVNTVGALEGERAKSKADLTQKYNASIGEIDAKINALESERVKAINDFNIAYTVKVSEQIEKLKAEREEKQAEVIKYNNELAKTENKEQIDRAKAESDLYGEALAQKEAENELLDNPSNAQKEREYEQIYALLREQLSKLDAVDARNEVVNNPLFRNYLSTAYYYRLYDEFAR
ncbi:MAG: hypothetical protein IKC64_05255 [Clostridia bacterium]|nr:hypothetical protein [Clostridia bacterium]